MTQIEIEALGQMITPLIFPQGGEGVKFYRLQISVSETPLERGIHVRLMQPDQRGVYVPIQGAFLSLVDKKS